MKKLLGSRLQKEDIKKMPDDGVFGRYYALLMRLTEDELSERCSEKGLRLPKLDDSLKKAMSSQLKKISLRTLLFEMQVSYELEELAGESDIELYEDFATNHLLDDEFLGEMYALYPELSQGLSRAIAENVDNLMGVLEAFESDRSEINQTMFESHPCTEIIRIGGGSSDKHKGGKTVYWVLLDNGEKLLYKSRSMAIDIVYQEFVKWVGGQTGCPYRWNKVLDRGEYGWCEWVEAETCTEYEQLRRYYRRNGILLCVSYLLGSEDMHYENLIACGEYPVIIDLEMGVGSRGISAVESEGPEVERIYRESVLQTGLLPLYAWNESGEGVNVGALNGAGGQLSPIRVPMVAEAGTVHMHIEYRQPKMAEGKNLVTLNGEFVEPYEFLTDIQEGFRSAYQLIAENRKMVWEKLRVLCGVPVRYLARETQQYAMMLTGSYLPQYMMYAKERKGYLREMNRVAGEYTDKREWCCIQEETELYRGDVPYFWYDPWKSDLYSATGEVFEHYFAQPVISCVERRLRQMNETDLLRQQKLIRNSLMIGTKGKTRCCLEREDGCGESCGKSHEEASACIQSGAQLPEKSLQVAEMIGDILLEEAIWSADKTNVGWISIIMAGYQERGYLMRPMGSYLYDGLAGAAVFFAKLAKQSSQRRFSDVARTLVSQLFRYTDKICQKESVTGLPTGAFCGEASVAYTYLLLYELSGEKLFLDYIKKQSYITARCMDEDKNYDVIGGNAGALLVFLRAYQLTGEDVYLTWARQAGDYLLQSATDFEWGIGWVNPVAGVALTGIAHGVSGMILGLAKLGYFTGEESYSEAALRAFQYEQHYFIPEAGDWRDLRGENREETADSGYDLAWCHGRGGILAAYRIAERYASGILKERLRAVMERAEMLHGDEDQKRAFCLCHGQMGNLGLIYLSGGQAAAREGHENLINRLAGFGKDELREELELQECDNFGLMGGIAGIGYGSLVGVEKIADILMVEGCFV